MPHSDYRVSLLTAKAFERRKCPTCGTFFWTFGENPCSGIQPHRPPAKRFSLRQMREEFLSLLEKRGRKSVRRLRLNTFFGGDANQGVAREWAIGTPTVH